MKVIDLRCQSGHRFEGWFGSAKDFASQRKRGLLSCPSCGSSAIDRGLSAPRLNMDNAFQALSAAPGSMP